MEDFSSIHILDTQKCDAIKYISDFTRSPVKITFDSKEEEATFNRALSFLGGKTVEQVISDNVFVKMLKKRKFWGVQTEKNYSIYCQDFSIYTMDLFEYFNFENAPIALAFSFCDEDILELILMENRKITGTIRVNTHQRNDYEDNMKTQWKGLSRFESIWGISKAEWKASLNCDNAFEICEKWSEMLSLPLYLSFDKINENPTKYNANWIECDSKR